MTAGDDDGDLTASSNHGPQQQQHNNNDKNFWKEDKIITVLPGDDVSQYVVLTDTKKKKVAVKIGDGLEYYEEGKGGGVVKATLAGRLQYRSSSHTYYVDSSGSRCSRYIPRERDNVLVVVEERVGMEYYRCNILNSVFPAFLHQIDGFDGATKRNKPNYAPGTLVYCRISHVCTDVMDPQISCKSTPPKDWMTHECVYGELKGGCGTVLTKVSPHTCRDLLRPDCVVLDALSKQQPSIPFEIAVGVNGAVWVNSEHAEHTILILNAIQNSQIITDEYQCRGMVKSLVKTMKQKQMQQQED